jgi:hypothetical protein
LIYCWNFPKKTHISSSTSSLCCYGLSVVNYLSNFTLIFTSTMSTVRVEEDKYELHQTVACQTFMRDSNIANNANRNSLRQDNVKRISERVISYRMHSNSQRMYSIHKRKPYILVFNCRFVFWPLYCLSNFGLRLLITHWYH